MARTTGLSVRDRIFHFRRNKKAKELLANLERAKGKLDRRLFALSNEYAYDVLGWRGYAHWLHVYSVLNGSFKEGWIPDNYYGRIVRPMLKGAYGETSSLRAFSSRLFTGRDDRFADKAYWINNLLLSRDYKVLDPSRLKEVLFGDSDIVVFKSDHSGRGQKISIIRKSTFDIDKLHSLGNGVFQGYIQQHEFFKSFMPNSVATLRLTTVLHGTGDASVRACYLRLGRVGDTHCRSSTSIRLPVNIRTGELYAIGHLPNWDAIRSHPDTGVTFANKTIPFFGECLSAVLSLQKSLPQVQCIGWDTVVDRDCQVKIMEWNGGHNGIKFTEATQGPCFADLGWEKLWKAKERPALLPGLFRNRGLKEELPEA